MDTQKGHPPVKNNYEFRGRITALEKSGSRLSFRVFADFEQSDWLNFTEDDFSDKKSFTDLKIGDLIARVEGQKIERLLVSKCKAPVYNKKFQKSEALAWQKFQQKIRSYFIEREFIELATPSLVSSPGLETFLDPFETEIEIGSYSKKVYLPTSPEFHLKKALCIGFEKIFEMAKVFRNSEQGEHHQLEFWMLEWYRAYDNLHSIKEDTKALIQSFFEEQINFEELNFKDLFMDYLSFELRPETTKIDLQQLCQVQKITYEESDSFDDLFFRIFLEKIEPVLQKKEWYFLEGFPPSQAALAKLTMDGWADRFELYFKDVELANAFHELNDSEEQRKRFTEALLDKERNLKKAVAVDEEFLEFLEYGMPPSGGIALGLDRLFMILQKKTSLEETRLFPFKM